MTSMELLSTVPPDYYQPAISRDYYLLEFLWVAPIIIGSIALIYAALSLRKSDALQTVFTCFILSILVLGTGVLATWRGGLQVWIEFGQAGDISPDLLYRWWRESWEPMFYAGGATAGLIMLALLARYRRPKPLSEGAA